MRFEMLLDACLTVGLYLLLTFVLAALILLPLAHTSAFKHQLLLSWAAANLLSCLTNGFLLNWFITPSMVPFVLIIIGQLPLSFMVWSVIQWGASVSLVRSLNQSRDPISMKRWIELSSFSESSVRLVENRINLLRKLGLVEKDVYQITTFGRFISTISRIRDRSFEGKIS